MSFPLSTLFKLAEPAAEDYLRPVQQPFLPGDPRGHIFEAQVELNYACQMLEVLLQLTQEARHADALPLEGWHGLLGAVQQHVLSGRRVLCQWQEEADRG